MGFYSAVDDTSRIYIRKRFKFKQTLLGLDVVDVSKLALCLDISISLFATIDFSEIFSALHSYLGFTNFYKL